MQALVVHAGTTERTWLGKTTQVDVAAGVGAATVVSGTLTSATVSAATSHVVAAIADVSQQQAREQLKCSESRYGMKTALEPY